uniref:Bacterial regulatory protein n=1 Tax=Siphoviridae sp. ctkJH11 TaxID=2825641 RepID=A0A8S5PR67_9CAUD|nr:MAG TPA: bacterial regulatory protein [Siphoviridae sp. ctkJH11]
MNMKQYSEYFKIPYRTVQDWKSGARKCPTYLLELMEYKLKKEKVWK